MPLSIVIFGATGDLMQSKLAPSLFRLWLGGFLPKPFNVVGFAKDELGTEEFQEKVKEMIAKHLTVSGEYIQKFVQSFSYQQGFFEDRDGYEKVAETLGRFGKEWRVCSNKLFYVAASPLHYHTILQHLAGSGITEPCGPEGGWTRIVVEKPFGKDLKTAQELDELLGKLFAEEQIYRIDHYLGKETVQNILAFRFSNSFLQDSWNNKGIEKISVRILEKGGIGERGDFYDGIGALRDVGQNHILQLLALFLMENPETFDGNSVRKKRLEILKTLHIPHGEEIRTTSSRGQYEEYGKEKNVRAGSQTETYFKIQTEVSLPQWKGVPIHLESGKGMAEDLAEVEIVFRHPTPCLCPLQEGKHYKNILYYSIQPREAISIAFWVKKPGPAMVLEQKAFSFDYRAAFQDEEFVDAHERLLLSVLQEDQTLFVSTEEIMASWKFIDSVMRGWEENDVPLLVYPQQSSSLSLHS